jgi:hypothetical protein
MSVNLASEKGKQIMSVSHYITMLITFFGAEIPVFMLILHMSNRIVKLETEVNHLIRRLQHERP